ncbi:Cu-processing system permease protein [Paenibacillus uliginis N3/975]|uniref:Cu-processing system permease protein n=1 Tax=Paenibacillus uliginis N3/975 TaxID=1313296 RepID=A0A1X7GAH9_9BACL|nr:ABC transporter permease [Paenibacillus uliginis]SMF66056.1 Cu-processing system permease protein [Paenibacillus uliginis N3/975]
MRAIRVIALREIKLGFRNPWSYSFMVLFALFSLALLAIQSQQGTVDYSGTTGAMINLILYLLPLMTLLLGSFSITAEKEEGGWQLLSTYPLSSSAYLMGKFTGMTYVLLIIVFIGFGLSGIISSLVTHSYTWKSFMLFLMFSVLLVLLFLGAAMFIGTLCKNRWQALTYSVAIWFFFVLGWPTLLIAVLGLVPYTLIKPLLLLLEFLNPAEISRLFLVIKLGGGSVLGPEYYKWVNWMYQPEGTVTFLFVCIVWIVVMFLAAVFMLERGRRHV